MAVKNDGKSMSKVRLHDLELIKIQAKKLKSLHPEECHSSRLNIATRNILKLQIYHDAKVINKKYMDSILIDQGNDLIKCKYCDFTFLSTLNRDIGFHNDFHIKREKAEFELGIDLLNYREQENIKKIGWKELKSQDKNVQFEGAVKVLKGHFHRSLDKAIERGYWKDHPSFNDYISMINLEGYSPRFSKNVIHKITTIYGTSENKIQKGKSD
jgi:hypothetical protein